MIKVHLRRQMVGFGCAAQGGALLHPLGRDRRRPRGLPRGRPRRRRVLPRPLEPRQGRPLHARRELHRARARGRCTSRTASSPGRRSRPTTPRSGPDRPEYEPRGCPRGAAFSWYTYSPTRVRYPYVRGVLVEMYREAKARLGDPVLAWADDRRRPGAAPPLPAGARQGRAGPGSLGRGGRDRRRRARAHHQDVRPGPVRRLLPDPGDVDGVALRRHPVHPAHRRRDDVVLRLVRRPAGGQPAGVRRPDRRPGVRRLVGRDLPDDVGLQRPGHPYAGRALDGRGALPRHQGGHASARTTRTTPSSPTSGCPRRPAPTPRWRWRWATSILKEFFVDRRGAVLRRLRAHVHRPAVPGHARPTPRRTAAWCPGSSSPPPTSAARRREPRTRVEDRAARRARPASRSCRTARWASATPSPAWAGGTSTSTGVDPAPCRCAGDGSRAGRGAAALLRGAGRHRLGAAPRRAGPPGRRPPGHHRLRPDARPVRRRPDGPAGRVADRLRRRDHAVHPGLAGGDHLRPGRGSASGSPASSPRTPRSPAAAR